jgi:hypothetical protein
MCIDKVIRLEKIVGLNKKNFMALPKEGNKESSTHHID